MECINIDNLEYLDDFIEELRKIGIHEKYLSYDYIANNIYKDSKAYHSSYYLNMYSDFTYVVTFDSGNELYNFLFNEFAHIHENFLNIWCKHDQKYKYSNRNIQVFMTKLGKLFYLDNN